MSITLNKANYTNNAINKLKYTSFSGNNFSHLLLLAYL